MVSRHWLYLGGSVIAGVLVVGAGLMGLVDGLSALAGGVSAGEEPVVLTALAAAAEWVAVAVGLGLVAAAFLAAAVVSVLRRASVPRDDRLVAAVERLERRYPVLRRLDVRERVEPTTEDRQERLRRRYVEGEMSEAEFEREMERTMDGGAGRASRHGPSRTRTVETDDETR